MSFEIIENRLPALPLQFCRVLRFCFETGIQNGPLAVLIVTLTFKGELQQQVLLIPILYSLFIVLTSSVTTMWYRKSATKEALARDNAKVRAAVSA